MFDKCDGFKTCDIIPFILISSLIFINVLMRIIVLLTNQFTVITSYVYDIVRFVFAWRSLDVLYNHISNKFTKLLPLTWLYSEFARRSLCAYNEYSDNHGSTILIFWRSLEHSIERSLAPVAH